MGEVRLGGLLVLYGLKNCQNPFALSRACLAAIRFQLTLSTTLLRHLHIGGRRINFKQLRVRFCAFMILMAVVSGGSTSSDCSMWVPIAGAQQGRKLVRQNRGG